MAKGTQREGKWINQAWIEGVVRRHPLIALMGLALLCLLGIALSDAFLSNLQMESQSYEIYSVPIGSVSGGGEPVLEVFVPRKVLRDTPGKDAIPIGVRIRYTTSLRVTEVPLSQYVVRFGLPSGVTLVDEEGTPVGSELILTASSAVVTPTLVYLQVASPASQRASPIEAKVEVYRLGNGDERLGSIPISIKLEGWWGSVLRRWLKAIIAAGSLVGSLLSVAGTYFARQQAEEREQQREEQVERALAEIESTLPDLLERDPSEAARWYYRRAEKERVFPWTDERVEERLQVVWESKADERLQKWMGIWRGERLAYGREIGEVVEWAFRTLDEEWKIDIVDWVVKNPGRAGDLLKEIEKELWISILKPWPSVRFYHRQPAEEVAFAYTRAEEDPWLAEEEAVLLPRQWEELDEHLWIVGAEGSGRTAAAFLVVWEKVLERIGEGRASPFPFYCRYPFLGQAGGNGSASDGAEAIAGVLAKALVHYITLRPNDFFEQGPAHRAAMSCLFAYFFGLQPRQYSLAGLSPHTTHRLLEDLGDLVGDARPPREEVLEVMGRAFPRGFQGLLLLLDVENTAGESARELIGLVDWLQGRNIGVKVFLPERLKGVLGDRSYLEWKWQEEDLRSLLKTLLDRVGKNAVQDWCEPMPGMDVEGWVVRAAGGTPRGLIEKLRELRERLEEKQQRKQKLSEEDLEELLRPYPEDLR